MSGGGVRHALFAGDIDEIGLQHLVAAHQHCEARMLVFPHHGGGGTKDPYASAKQIASLVRPEVVIVSIGRGRFATPHPDVVRGVIDSVPSAHIACTQLSKRCAPDVPSSSPAHLIGHAASGRGSNACCAGTIDVDLSKGTYSPARDTHRVFVLQHAPLALCGATRP